MKDLSLIVLAMFAVGCEVPEEALDFVSEETEKELSPITTSCLWHGGTDHIEIRGEGQDVVVCSDGAVFPLNPDAESFYDEI